RVIKCVELKRCADDFRAHVAASKFKSTPGFGEAQKGRILLQDHGDAVAFRSIKIRTLNLLVSRDDEVGNLRFEDRGELRPAFDELHVFAAVGVAALDA